MTDERKQDIEDTVKTLKQLDKESLAVMKAGAELLKAREILTETKPQKPKKTG